MFKQSTKARLKILVVDIDKHLDRRQNHMSQAELSLLQRIEAELRGVLNEEKWNVRET